MTEPPEECPLTEWNRLNIDNTENALVSHMYASAISSTYVYDTYSTWLMAGVGATTALLITNIDSVLPFLSAKGFKWSGLLFVASILFGVISKFLALQCQISDQNNEKNTKKISEILNPFYSQAEQIKTHAKQQGISLVTDIEMTRVIEKFVTPFPRWAKWLFKKFIIKQSSNPQAGFLIPLRFFRWQCSALLLQVCTFVAGVALSILHAQGL
jgi:hypothetical protein